MAHTNLMKMDPELKEILDKSPPMPALSRDIPIAHVRAYLEAQAAAQALNAPQANEGIEIEDRSIPMRDGALIPIRIYKPTSPPDGGCPIFVAYHGGGYCIGGFENQEELCREWATKFGGVAVNVLYRLAPEHSLPVPVHDCFDALKWTAENIDNLGVKTNPQAGFIAGGESAGATSTAANSHLYRDDKISPPLTGLYLGAPTTVYPDAVPEKYKAECVSRTLPEWEDPIYTKETAALFTKNNGLDPFSPLTSPLLYPDHANLPPTYFQIGGMDPMIDENILYERVLREDYGIKTKIDIHPGLPHIFWTSYKDANFTKNAKECRLKGFQWLLDQQK